MLDVARRTSLAWTAIPRTTVHYDQLPTGLQAIWDNAESKAFTALEDGDIPRFKAIQRTTAKRIGVSLTPGSQLAKCFCPDCGYDCDAILDLRTAAEYADGAIYVPHCLDCHAEHPQYGN